MDDHQEDALLEELRKLRGDVRALRITFLHGIALLGLVTVAIAFEVKWFKESLFGVAIAGSIAWFIWVLYYQKRRDVKETRKRQTPARMIITATPPSAKT